MPPLDARFLDCTPEDVLLDYWAHRHVDDPTLRNEEVAEDFDEDMAEMELELGLPHEPPALPDSDFETVANDEFGGA